MTGSTPIAIEVAQVRTAIATIESCVMSVVADVTRVAPEISPVGAQFCSRSSITSIFSELAQISLAVTSIGPQVATIRSNVSRIGTEVASILAQIAAFPSIDTPLLGHDHT